MCYMIPIFQGANSTDYGARASQDLIVTRGAGFRKEKNKKKRGSYRGGEISVSRRDYRYAPKLTCLSRIAAKS